MKETPNLEYVDKLSGDDADFRQRFINILKEEFPQEKLDYEKSKEKEAYVEASENVHKLKHKFNILGLNRSHSLAVRYELELRNGTCNLASEFEDVLSYIESYLKTI